MLPVVGISTKIIAPDGFWTTTLTGAEGTGAPPFAKLPEISTELPGE